ncbi:putative cytoplasmic protein [Escherichia coli]|nr:putative cytoplasmic protein [Escherichia coli]
MDEYSPKRHDIAQLKFLCETLYHDCLANLEESNHGWVNDPTSAINLQLNELIEHIATFALNYKIKYNEDNKLIEQIDEYLDDTFMLFSSYGINMQDLQKWRKSGNRLFRCFVNATKENPGFAPIFPDICYHLTHYKPAAADIPVASDNPAHYADAIRYNARTPLQGSLLPLTRLVWA